VSIRWAGCKVIHNLTRIRDGLHRGRKRGFTLIEVLVVIAVIVVLLALVVAAVGSARRSAIRLACGVHARTCGQAMMTYAGDYRDRFPMFASPTADPAFRNGGLGLPYFLQSAQWPLVARSYLGGARLNPAQVCPADGTSVLAFKQGGLAEVLDTYPDSYVFPAGYQMMMGAISDPTLWQAEGVQGGDKSKRRAVRITEVSFPSQKGMLFEVRADHDRVKDRSVSSYDPDGAGSHAVTFTDGSVFHRRQDQLKPGCVNLSGGQNPPVITTPDGARGRDTIAGP